MLIIHSPQGATAKVAWSGPGAPPAPPISSATAEVVCAKDLSLKTRLFLFGVCVCVWLDGWMEGGRGLY